MGLCHFVLLVVAVLLASTDPSTASRNSQLSTPGAPAHALESNIPTQRLLRASDDDDAEERGITAKIPVLENLSNALKSSKTKEVEVLLQAKESVTGAFKKLNLNTMPIGSKDFVESKKVGAFFSSSNFKTWSKYATKVDKQDPHGAMVSTLTNLFGEKNLAIMILLGKDSWNPSTKNIAKKLETAQFNSWFNQNKRPDGMLESVFHVKVGKIHGSSRAKSVWINYMTYVRNRVKNY